VKTEKIPERSCSVLGRFYCTIIRAIENCVYDFCCELGVLFFSAPISSVFPNRIVGGFTVVRRLSIAVELVGACNQICV
jgi:hypothetical protein